MSGMAGKTLRAWSWRPGARLKSGPAGRLGIVICACLAILALCAPWLAPHDPNAIDLTLRLTPPLWMEGGDARHVLGTDALGRDLLSRLIHGARVSLAVGLAASCLAGTIGFVLGLLAGYFGGWLDRAVALVVDVLLSVPMILLMLVFASVLGQGMLSLVLVIGLTTWVTYARVTRSEVMSLRERQFVLAGRALGAGSLRIVLTQVAPNAFASFIVLATMGVAGTILAEASLGFLGFGIGAGQVSWGGMLNDGRPYLATSWWLAVAPGIAITVCVLGISWFGDLLRDAFDPRQQGSA